MDDKLYEYNLTRTQFYIGVILAIYCLTVFYGYLWNKILAIPFTYFFAPIMLFTAGIWAINRLKNNEAGNLLKTIYVALFLFVAVVDVVWNHTVGIFAYKKLPRCWLFTTATKNNLGSRDKELRETAVYWAIFLNHIDPTPHIDISRWLHS